MRAVPRRFLVVYVLAFGLLFVLGQFAAGRAADESWTRNPLLIRKGGPDIDFVRVYLMRDEIGGEIRFIVASENDEGGLNAYDDQWRTPEELDGYLGSIYVTHTLEERAFGPFTVEYLSYFGAIYDIKNGENVPGSVLNEASRIGVRRARSAYDTAYIAEDAMPLSQQYELPRGIVKHHSYEFMMPLWLIITTFAFIPLVAAWAVNAATVKRKLEVA